MAEQLTRPGSCNIHSASIINAKGEQIDVTKLIIQIDLYEDIMSPFVSGSVTLSDANSMAEALPLIGEELFVLDIETPYLTERESKFSRTKKQFFIYKMASRENATLKNVLYTLHFVSIEAFIDVNTKISQTFRGNISDIVTKLIKQSPGLGTSKEAIIERSTNNEIFTSNFWTPTQSIYYLTGRANNVINNPSFVFFENNEGFIFMSLDTLLSAQPTTSFVKSQKMREAKGSFSNDEEYEKILDMSTPVMYDYFDRLEQGYYGGNVYHYDIETKRLNFKNVVAKDDIKKGQLNKHVTIGNALPFLPDANQHLSIIQRNLYTNSPGVAIDHHVRRMALLKQLQSISINIQAYGRLDYSVGRVVNFTAYKDTPIDESMTGDQLVDEVLSGKYIITALHHEITLDGHLCNIELSKDSLTKPVVK